MSNVVQFLENLACNPKPLSSEEFATGVIAAGLEPAEEKALVEKDIIGLNRALGSRLNIMCLIVPAENDEPQEGEEKEGDDQVPEQEISSRAA